MTTEKAPFEAWYRHPKRVRVDGQRGKYTYHTMAEIPEGEGLCVSLQRLRAALKATPPEAIWEFYRPTPDRNEGVLITWSTPTRRGRLLLHGQAAP